MTTRYDTREGDTVDYIAWRHYGTADASAPLQVLQANPGLADRGPVLPAGVTITLPELATPAQVEGVRLWD
jgi:phage tail protein X